MANQPNESDNATGSSEFESEGRVGDAPQDPKRRLGNFTGKGEAARIQPGGSNDSHAKAGQRRGSGASTPKPKKR